MKKLFVFFTLVSCLVACHKSLSDQAAQEAADFTRKYCPTPIKDFERTDSMTFDRSTKTFIYWKTLYDKSDDKGTDIEEQGQTAGCYASISEQQSRSSTLPEG